MTVMRKFGGVLAGVLAAGAVIAGVETAGHSLAGGEAVFAFAIAGYGLGALAGAMVCTMIAGRRPSIAVPLVLAVLAILNLFALPHPVWFVPAAAAALAGGWWIGTRLAPRRAAA